jgi:hypothetical protein
MLAKIYRPAKTAMQSGKAGLNEWVLEFTPEDRRPTDPLMGWTGSLNPSEQVRLTFETQEQAVAYARARNIPHRVITPNERKITSRSYSENFAFGRREPWSH